MTIITPSSEAVCADYPDSVYLRALLEVKNLGNQTIFKLLQRFKTPAALWKAPASSLNEWVKPAVLAALQARKARGLDGGWLKTYADLGIQVISRLDADYPPLLNEIHNPPLLLYVKGALGCLEGQTLAFVGTRKASEYGRQCTEKLVAELKPAEACIVSGLAAGIDTCAHWAAIQAGLPTVAVFGCGLDVIYPSSNRKLAQAILAEGGAWVSEYPVGTMPTQYTFPQRNRIVAGLSHGIVVVEGDVKSGALITARLAVDEGRTVYATPGNLFSPGSQGPHYLIKNGAFPVTEGVDILNDLGWRHQADGNVSGKSAFLTAKTPQVADSKALAHLSEEERVLAAAISFESMSIEDLQGATGFASAKINELLTLLELEGLIVLLPGAKVCRK
ncbi:DNA-processing protein DprA [Vampirovibrio sp.]|uniref:DNA-processing protein DprA n=1 Tax=Vampirovibrio sp. TaxID=2717857 RepID=UPI0035936803